ncbi:hypothetical protein [Coxiella burnetii]|uniref:Uncharacterized protein n=1 Tax=Coxiella burnetii (strain RSA 493 / Nine Mile phase I) TaxID=227377 RepID=B5QS81_COXBU|nr:hypothetical protein [Coxiella burnetii]YP_002332953.1 hypothetical protein CBU_0221a [Coxiella burnetii RSA 493]ABX77515.1 hypothetical protein COXBURSA331_A0316 [Coxiella burnetii RSA 331]ACI15244.1 hypothetical protein CBU_0221a [Coxiella burnetii RSA 493]AIT62724.1 hypothetical protein CBNA_0384 [Coxiella burnetii str. Namibia]ARI65121.1 hypothetical protein B7L74_01150 [Coxiella burnetii]AZV74439.1 hypothetical protein D6219_00350 [Coxiella burnetii]
MVVSLRDNLKNILRRSRTASLSSAIRPLSSEKAGVVQR